MRSPHTFLVLLTLFGLNASRLAVADDRPRRVRLIDSFARGALPIDQDNRLPAGGAGLFRPPSVWQLYPWTVFGVLSLMALQTVLIAGLLIQRRRRNRAEGQLAESERRMHLIADSLPVLIAHVDREQRYVFMNRAYEAWFNIDPDTARGRPVREVLGNDFV